MKTAVRIATKETREGCGGGGYIDGYAATYRLSEPLWGHTLIQINEEKSISDGWQITVGPVAENGDFLLNEPFVFQRGKAGKKFNAAFFDLFLAEYGYSVEAEERRYSMAEIMAAFEVLKRDLDENFGEGAGAAERFLIDDVAADVRTYLELWAAGLKPLVGELAGAA